MSSLPSARRLLLPPLLLLLSLTTLILANAHDDVVSASESFRASVDAADAAVGAAHAKRDVVDLGASLRLVEERFSALRSSLLSEMGADTASAGATAAGKAADLQRHARELTTKGGEMIRKLAASRAQVHAVLAEVRTMDGATTRLREGVAKLEGEIAELGAVIGQAHTDNNVLFSAHHELRASVKEANWRAAALPGASAQLTRLHIPRWYYIVLAEFAVLLVFGAWKVWVVRKKDKFSKLG